MKIAAAAFGEAGSLLKHDGEGDAIFTSPAFPGSGQRAGRWDGAGFHTPSSAQREDLRPSRHVRSLSHTPQQHSGERYEERSSHRGVGGGGGSYRGGDRYEDRRGGYDRPPPRYRERSYNRGGGYDRPPPRYDDRSYDRGGYEERGYGPPPPRFGEFARASPAPSSVLLTRACPLERSFPRPPPLLTCCHQPPHALDRPRTASST